MITVVNSAQCLSNNLRQEASKESNQGYYYIYPGDQYILLIAVGGVSGLTNQLQEIYGDNHLVKSEHFV